MGYSLMESYMLLLSDFFSKLFIIINGLFLYIRMVNIV